MDAFSSNIPSSALMIVIPCPRKKTPSSTLPLFPSRFQSTQDTVDGPLKSAPENRCRSVKHGNLSRTTTGKAVIHPLDWGGGPIHAMK